MARTMTSKPFRLRTVRIRGHEVGYRMAGKGPTVVLIHGIAGSSTTWREVMPALAERNTVIAPDLLGHGQSAKPRGDYSLGPYASGVRDLLTVLDQEGVPSSVTRSAVASPCNLPTSFPSVCNDLCLLRRADSAKRSDRCSRQ